MKIFIFIILITFSLGISQLVVAATSTVPVYVPMVGIPGLDPDTQTTDMYVRALYILSITVAAFLAVVKIIFGGVKWMLSDVVTDKSAAKKDIWGAILGLLIVLSAVLILNTINPNLTRLNFLENAAPISINLNNNNKGSSTPTPYGEPRYFTGAQSKEKKEFEENCAGEIKFIRGSKGGSEIMCVAPAEPASVKAEIGDSLDTATATDKQENVFHTTCRGRLITEGTIMRCLPKE